MDRREAAKWQIRQCRKDILIQALAAAAAIIVAATFLISAARSETFDIRFGALPNLPDAGPRIIHIPQEDGADKRERAWLNACDPAEVRIMADYMKIENGHLIFREEVRHSYPNTVRVFAPGAWREVIELS